MGKGFCQPPQTRVDFIIGWCRVGILFETLRRFFLHYVLAVGFQDGHIGTHVRLRETAQ
jgi:hypothetical protein